MSAAVHLDPESVEAVARRVAELLRDEHPDSGDLVDAAEIARRFGVSRDWVYRHAPQLGCVRLGEGQKGRLRFDPAAVAQHLGAAQEVVGATRRPARRRATKQLLPVHDSGRC
jgi:hypothetical protein